MTGGMGSDRHFAEQQSSGLNVRLGSKAEVKLFYFDVLFTPKSGHWNSAAVSALCQ
jgi:hypothetical protein